MTASAQHSSASNEHYTPIEIVQAARLTMGGIDLDPASTLDVNRHRVKASYFYSKADDGLSKPWYGNVWLNPPGGRVGNRSSAAVWWSKLVEEFISGRVTQAVFLGFSIELLATAQDARLWPGDVPFCIPRRRIEFLAPGRAPDEFVAGESPTHSNLIVYLPPERTTEAHVARFVEAFQGFGKVRT